MPKKLLSPCGVTYLIIPLRVLFKNAFTYLLIAICTFCYGIPGAWAQEITDSSQHKGTDADSAAPPVKHIWQPSPKKAGMYSALIPGLGQAYNRQYWKVPVIYAGLAVAGYFFVDNLNNYQDYRKAYIGRVNNPYPTDKYVGIYTIDQLNQLQNDYNRYLDLTVLFSTIGYALQIMDAITSAHLRTFDISRDISMKFAPVANPQGLGIGLVVRVKDRPAYPLSVR